MDISHLDSQERQSFAFYKRLYGFYAEFCYFDCRDSAFDGLFPALGFAVSRNKAIKRAFSQADSNLSTKSLGVNQGFLVLSLLDSLP